MIALCPGSFDPVTNGHVDVITRASGCFDQLVVAVVLNPAKPGRLPAEQRLELLRRSCQPAVDAAAAAGRRIEFISAGGLLVDVASTVGASVLVKGLRSGSDFDHERSYAVMNESLAGIDTVFFASAPQYSFFSSSLVWEIASLHGDVSAYVPTPVVGVLADRFGPGAASRTGEPASHRQHTTKQEQEQPRGR